MAPGPDNEENQRLQVEVGVLLMPREEIASAPFAEPTGDPTSCGPKLQVSRRSETWDPYSS